MPPLVIPNAALVSCSGSWLGEPWTNVYGLTWEGDQIFFDQTMANAIGSIFRSFYSSIAGSLSDDWNLSEVILYDLQEATAPSWEAVIVTLPGTNNGNNLGTNIAGVVTHRTGMRGRRYLGRTYLAGFTENDNDADGTWNATTRTAVTNAFTALRAALLASSVAPLELAVVSRAGLFATPIVTHSANPYWDHQDRRKRR